MKKLLLLWLIPMLSLIGCSDQDGGDIDSGPSAQTADSEQEQTRSIKPILNEVDADLEGEDYDKLLEDLAVLHSIPKTRDQELELKKKRYEVQVELQKRAETDPEARRAYHNYGRMMTGR